MIVQEAEKLFRRTEQQSFAGCPESAIHWDTVSGALFRRPSLEQYWCPSGETRKIYFVEPAVYG